MKITTLKQGSPDWHQFRSCHFGASEAPSMLGESKFKSRNQLLHEKATGIVPEVDAATQRRFDDGHRAEELARGLAEAMINDDLYPATGEDGKLSASFDGLTLDQSTAWEHKLLNDTLRACDTAADLPVCYRIQMEQCLMLSGAERCLFSATKWDDAGNLIEEKHLWYTPDHDLRERLLQGWTQFAIDLENYQHVEHAEKPKAEAIMQLPALSVQATGMVTYSNLPEFKAAAESYIANINTDLQTDQQFADAEATVKFCKTTEETLEVTKKAILAQTQTIDEVIRTVDHIQTQLRDKRLMLDKLVKSEKEARRHKMVSDTNALFTAHLADLQAEIAGIRLDVPSPRFVDVIKGLKSLSSMHDALDTALANAKIEADSIATDVRAKLAWCKENAAGMSFLFHDLAQIIIKPMEDFALTITSRIEAHKKAEADKLEAQRAAIQAEEERKATAKAQAEAEAIVAAERAKQAEEDAKAKAKAETEAKARAKVEAERAVLSEKAEAGAKANRYLDDLEDRMLSEQEAAKAQPEQSTKPDNVVVIEHQDVIGAFMSSRDFGKDAGKIRAVIVEFVKFSEHFGNRRAA